MSQENTADDSAASAPVAVGIDMASGTDGTVVLSAEGEVLDDFDASGIDAFLANLRRPKPQRPPEPATAEEIGAVIEDLAASVKETLGKIEDHISQVVAVQRFVEDENESEELLPETKLLVKSNLGAWLQAAHTSLSTGVLQLRRSVEIKDGI